MLYVRQLFENLVGFLMVENGGNLVLENIGKYRDWGGWKMVDFEG